MKLTEFWCAWLNGVSIFWNDGWWDATFRVWQPLVISSWLRCHWRWFRLYVSHALMRLRSLMCIVLSCVMVIWSALYGDQERMRSVFECICVWTPRCVVLYDSSWYWQVFYSYASLLLLASLWLLVVVFLFGVYQGVRRHALCCLYAADVLLTFFKLYVPPGHLICTIFIFDCVCYLWFHSFVLGGGLHCNGVLVGHTSSKLRSFEWVIRLF